MVTETSSMSYGMSVSESSSVGLLPCSYRGTPILHGESLMVDECTTCECDNSTVKCTIKSCGHTWCDDPIKFDGQCCEVCPQCKFKSSEDRNWNSCNLFILYVFLTHNCIRGNSMVQSILFFRLWYFNAGKFLTEYFCNCLNGHCASLVKIMRSAVLFLR